jgi:DNA-binding NarL/FixJ family response regulator
MSTLRILLVDDHLLFRKGLVRLLDAQPDFEVVGEAADGLEAIGQAEQLRPDLVLMDIRMPTWPRLCVMGRMGLCSKTFCPRLSFSTCVV